LIHHGILGQEIDKSRELNLEGYSEMLKEEQGNRLRELFMVKRELRCTFRDPREHLKPPSNEQLFEWIYGISTESIKPVMIVPALITKCDERSAFALLENGTPRFISIHNLEKDGMNFTLTDEILQADHVYQFVIIKVKKDRISVDLSRLRNDFEKINWERDSALPQLDRFDQKLAMGIFTEKRQQQAMEIMQAESESRKPSFKLKDIFRRTVPHDAWMNLSYTLAETEVKKIPVGEVIFRPSSPDF
jgi:transcriptional accessory protein Tex/SPT6